MTKKGETKRKDSHKKHAKKKTVHHKTEHHSDHHSTTTHHPHDINVEKVLVENFVSLQKVMTNLSVKFDSLSTQISKLLELFEISAKTMAQKDFELGGKNDEEMMKKLDTLLDQNKIIARGLTLLHEPEEMQVVSQPQIMPPRPVPQMQRPQMQIPPMPGTSKPFVSAPPMQKADEGGESNVNIAEYQKSRHIDESQNLNFDIGRNEKEEKKDEFSV